MPASPVAAVQKRSLELQVENPPPCKDFDARFGRDGIFARLFAHTLEQMPERELSQRLGYEPYETKGRNSGNNRNGRYAKKVRTSSGDTSARVARDRNASFEPKVLKKFASNTNELEEKILGLYARDHRLATLKTH